MPRYLVERTFCVPEAVEVRAMSCAIVGTREPLEFG